MVSVDQSETSVRRQTSSEEGERRKRRLCLKRPNQHFEKKKHLEKLDFGKKKR
jgi:hypothetical protein